MGGRRQIHHIKRVVGEELFTYEQFTMFVIEIEAILNSRPLTPLSSDPNDISTLTPGHFLIGGSLTCITETDFSQTPSNRLSTWQHIQKVKQDFWKRWHKEYIHQLNVRHKWTKGGHNINIGTVVLLKDDSLPSLCWISRSNTTDSSRNRRHHTCSDRSYHQRHMHAKRQEVGTSSQLRQRTIIQCRCSNLNKFTRKSFINIDDPATVTSRCKRCRASKGEKGIKIFLLRKTQSSS
ncbi:uncharacterized protein LOC143217777 [Lasioglossum baleicum]|uniref:uncharacterized protein LOC143217777 n=1 Tax=Lasioglossum baleicum TaxID=434251 RepID=UPI003FCD56C7